MRNLQTANQDKHSEYAYTSEADYVTKTKYKSRISWSNNATRLASNLFSYYYRGLYRKKSANHSSVALHKVRSSYLAGKDRDSFLKTESDTKQTSNYPKELMANPDRIISVNHKKSFLRENNISGKRPISNDSTEVAKYSTANNISIQNMNQNIPLLPEHLRQNFMLNKSLSKINIESTQGRRKRKLDISHLASNLNMKDWVPKFSEGVRKQMEKRHNCRITTNNNWYQNLETPHTYQRNSKTASNKSRLKDPKNDSRNGDLVSDYVKGSEQSRRDENMKIEYQEKGTFYHSNNVLIYTSKFEPIDMVQMIKDTYEQYISLDDWNISYPNDYVEWSLSNLYSDILADELKDFNHERSFKILNENEVDYILDMVKTRYKDFKETDMFKPFYLKTHLTVKKLGEDIGLSPIQTDMFLKPYTETNIDTTIAMLNKLKRLFFNRNIIIEILKDIKQRELYSTLIKDRIKEIIIQKSGNISDPELQKTMGKNLTHLNEVGLNIIRNIKKLSNDGTIFSNYCHKGKMLFKFANKDYISYIDHDMHAINNLMHMLHIFKEYY